ncbi:triose-phosphate transporter family-domain-containing protein [Hypoxylon rubiginosum]|uniref:Triose-phosphate transporter family-domain-containing protein n=1 Tax=Hypoxylon rubiginosum TaxID=110542 RepID=A0ACC0DC22_9PEZI|nr:triose-phosphate transporter family-domain-containing protein [Hypoxylon rubiginosum]
MAAQDKDARTLESGGVTGPTSWSARIHPAFYIVLWIAMSSSVILFNKWVLASAHFDFPLFLTTWHMVFATVMTQVLARTTSVLDSRHAVPMDTPTYMQAIVPIGAVFSLSLIFGNLAYLYLSVSFIQMLKATNVAATLLATWFFGMAAPDGKKMLNVLVIVAGIVIASFGELKFDLIGFLFQISGIVAEAVRLVMVQRLLSGDFKMDPLVSVYYYAPACAAINSVFTLFFEIPRMSMDDIWNLGIFVLLANAFIAFLLNVSVVLLIGKTSAVVLTLSGVLKDILLVISSLVIFGDPVTGQQYVGYSVALGGLVYYKLGAEKLQSVAADARLYLTQGRGNLPSKLVQGVIYVGLALVVLAILGYWRGANVASLTTPGV